MEPALARVTLARPWTDANGVTHQPDTTVAMPRTLAKSKVRGGSARWPTPEAKPAPATGKPRQPRAIEGKTTTTPPDTRRTPEHPKE